MHAKKIENPTAGSLLPIKGALDKRFFLAAS
jgi:hypothetical protein